MYFVFLMTFLKKKETCTLFKNIWLIFEMHDSAEQWIARKILMITPEY